MLAIGIQNADLAELKVIATHDDDDVFLVESFNALAEINAEIGNTVCEVGLTF